MKLFLVVLSQHVMTTWHLLLHDFSMRLSYILGFCSHSNTSTAQAQFGIADSAQPRKAYLLNRLSEQSLDGNETKFFSSRSHTSLASITVPTPTVSAVVGTLDMSPPKNRALALMVSTARDLILVLDTSEEPGSLKAMCPSGPMPIVWCGQ